MKPAKKDWIFLRAHTLVPGASLLVAIVILGVSFWYHGEQKRVFDSFSSNQEMMYQNYDQLIHRRRLLDRYYRRYQELQESGFVGQESRLDWIETIRSTAKRLDLPNVAYSVEPQREVLRPVESASSTAQIQIYLSRVQFELGLVHELDLLRFFRRLEEEAPGLMKVDRCSLARQLGPDTELVAESNIVATCSMALFSVITSDIGFAAADTGL